MRRTLMFLPLLALLAGCASPAAAPESTVPASEPTLAAPTAAEPPTADSAMAPTAAAGAFGPLTLADCQAVHDAVTTAVGARFAGPIDAAYTDEVTQQSGTACTMEADGTGADFESPAAVMAKINAALTAAGWSEDKGHQADGPTGTSTAFTQGANMVVASANWEPSPDANCPKDQPIAACPLKPEQQIYQVRLFALTQNQ